MAESPDLSIVILNYNVKDLLLNCLESIFKNKWEKDSWQVIVVDNASSDGSDWNAVPASVTYIDPAGDVSQRTYKIRVKDTCSLNSGSAFPGIYYGVSTMSILEITN